MNPLVLDEISLRLTRRLKHDNVAIDFIENSAGLASGIIFVIPFATRVEIGVIVAGRCLFLDGVAIPIDDEPMRT